MSWEWFERSSHFLKTSEEAVENARQDNNQNYLYYKNQSDASLIVCATSDLVTSL